MKEYISGSDQETKSLARRLGEKLWAGSCVLLSGDLGAGKTSFTQGLGLGLGIKRTISSPTFTMMKLYSEGRLVLYHLDAYRLEHSFQDVGFSDFIGKDGVTVIEWPEYLEPLLPKEFIKVTLSYIDEDERRLVFEAVGEKYQSLIEEIVC